MRFFYKSLFLCTLVFSQVAPCIAQYDRIVWSDISSGNTFPDGDFDFIWSYLGSRSPFPSDARIESLAFGLFVVQTTGRIYLETYGKDVVATGGGQNPLVTPLDAGVIIGPSSNWQKTIPCNTTCDGGALISSLNFTEWHGKSAYIGLQVFHINQLHYGWIKVGVSSDGQEITLEETAIHLTPNQQITTGDRGDDNIPLERALTQESTFLCMSITNVGRLGYVGTNSDIDPSSRPSCRSREAQTRGIGFIDQGNQLLYEGGLILALDATRVLSTVRGNEIIIDQDMDLTQRPGSVMEVSEKDSGIMYGTVELTDENAAYPIGVSVHQESFSYEGSFDYGKFMLLRYTIKNESQQPINDLFAGLWLDWDLGSDIQRNTALYDRDRNLGYVQSDVDNRSIAGVRVLSNEYPIIFSHAANIEDDLEGNNSLRIRENKWKLLTSRIQPRTTLLRADIFQITSVGPISILPGDESDILFALVTGDSVQELQDNSDQALTAAETALLVSSEPSPVPRSFISIGKIYPNPTTDQATLSFRLSNSAHVEVGIYDLIGRHVHSLLARDVTSGLHEVTWNVKQTSLPMGVYAVRLSVDHGAHEESQFIVVR